MPLIEKFDLPGATIGIWRIEEDISWFEPKFDAVEIANENKRLQWYATRHLANELCGRITEVKNNEAGKPFLADRSYHISISHTPVYAAVMLSEKYAVGIDLETLNPKVEHIAHKFLREDEVANIRPDEKIKKLILYWSAKESLYKLYGSGNLEFKTQLLIEPFEMKQEGELTATIKPFGEQPVPLTVFYRFFEQHVLSYVTAGK